MTDATQAAPRHAANGHHTQIAATFLAAAHAEEHETQVGAQPSEHIAWSQPRHARDGDLTEVFGDHRPLSRSFIVALAVLAVGGVGFASWVIIDPPARSGAEPKPVPPVIITQAPVTVVPPAPVTVTSAPVTVTEPPVTITVPVPAPRTTVTAAVPVPAYCPGVN